MKLGQTLESKGEFKAAAETYKKLKDDYPATAEGQQAEKYITRAEAKSN